MTDEERRELYDRKAATTKVCKWNDAVRCWERTVAHCGRCGWNPAEDKRRRNRLGKRF